MHSIYMCVCRIVTDIPGTTDASFGKLYIYITNCIEMIMMVMVQYIY